MIISSDYEEKIPENEPVVLLCEEMERLDYSRLNEAYSRDGRKPAVTPKVMFMILVFAYMNNIYSSREIEKACKFDIRFMYILQNERVPDHNTISRFRSKRLEGVIEDIFNQFVLRLQNKGELSCENIFIDGTKIEACANRYTFVWKKSVEKNRDRLLTKVAVLMSSVKDSFNICINENRSKLHMLNQLINKLEKARKEANIEFVYGRGHKKTDLQKFYETAQEYRSKLLEYMTHLKKMGTRNSYCKTDNDATFMRMKEDHMRNGQLKPAYNVQAGVDSGYVVGIQISQERSDSNTLIPFLKMSERELGFKYENVVADAGYDSEENFVYLSKNKQEAYIKPATYERSKTRRYKNDIGLAENMYYSSSCNLYICQNDRPLYYEYEKQSKTKSGYIRSTSVYKSESCEGCPYKEKCIKTGNCKTPIEERTKHLYVSRTHTYYKEKAQEMITSEKGRQLRMNRSIQVEGFFGVIKEDMRFRRFLTRGMVKVGIEMKLLGMAFNILKYHHKKQQNATQKHLYDLKAA